MPRTQQNPDKYFEERVERTSGCWNWTGTINRLGYGVFACGKRTSSHRWAYSRFVKSIDPGMMVLHKCNNPKCVRPDHLKQGTHRDNMKDRQRNGKYTGDYCNGRISRNLVMKIHGATGTENEIASRFGVSRSVVNSVKTGRAWISVTGGPSELRRKNRDSLDKNASNYVVYFPTGESLKVRNLSLWLKTFGASVFGEDFNIGSARSGLTTSSGYKGFTAKRLDNQQT